ncbi:zeta-carotene-forming phytoene desaturase [Pontiella desulfatans]|uniref:Zeta-carotene-forming phytoene desaturase n=1 Tax=Pontiella desulfatans TaxID=2750659 RepID=A0A6C2TW69_PONDE|nr:zeta-carotene-forming phytoene desaturase [Pontiella desulfatans]
MVVGGGLGGLSAAIHLQLKGFHVTLLEKNKTLGGRANRIEAEGFRFDTGPSLLNYPWVFEELFEAAGKKMTDYMQLIPVDPSITFHWPDQTSFTLSSQITKLVSECEKIETGVSAKLFAFLSDAECKYRFSFDKLVLTNEDNPLKWVLSLKPRELAKMGVWHSLHKELGRFFKSPYLREAFGSYAMYLGGSPWALPGLFSILPYGELAYGLWLPKGGIYGMVEALQKLATDVGVQLRTECAVQSISTHGKKVTGVVTEDGTTIDCPIVVSNVDVPQTQAELLDAPAYKKQKTPRMTCGVVTLYWGLRHKDTGLPHHSIFLPSDSRTSFGQLMDEETIPDELPFYICLASETEPSMAPKGQTSAFVLAPVPLISKWGEDWEPAVKLIKERVFDRLKHHGTNLGEEDILVERVWTPVEWRDQFGLFDGSAFGAAHHLFEVGPFRAKNYDTQIRGLYYVGASTTPGTGMPMVILGGKMTAERVCSHVL